MTSQELISLIKNPRGLNDAELIEIKDLAAKFPYSGLLQLLYAKGLHVNGDLKSEDQIKKCALVISDRGVLYNTLYKAKVQQIISKVDKQSEKDLNGATDAEIKPVVDKVEVETVNQEKIEELEEGIILEAINTSIQMDVDSLLHENIEDNTKEHDLVSNEDLEFKVEASSNVVEDKSKKPEKLSDWLFAMKPVDEVLEGDDQEKAKDPQKEKPLKSTNDLIDKFLATKLKRIVVPKEPVSPKEMGKMSLVENEDFVTETLAGIYAKQGKYQKAIKIYEQLSLNFPEKKTFFASRIRFLREKMEYNNG